MDSSERLLSIQICGVWLPSCFLSSSSPLKGWLVAGEVLVPRPLRRGAAFDQVEIKVEQSTWLKSRLCGHWRAGTSCVETREIELSAGDARWCRDSLVSVRTAIAGFGPQSSLTGHNKLNGLEQSRPQDWSHEFHQRVVPLALEPPNLASSFSKPARSNMARAR